jgi:lipoprotein-anchoring transpeptidase ErfK/SrfK
MGKGTRAAGQRGRAASSDPSSSGPTPPAAQRRAADQRPSKRGSGRGATFSVLIMTIASLAGVGVLAAQAKATAPRVRASASVAVGKTTTAKSGTTSTTTSQAALPANSGSGTRVVYSVGERRVWLVTNSTVERTIAVVPGTIAAPDGTYTVDAKSPGATGSDGVQVLYVVRFDADDTTTTFGFDSEAGITGLPPAPTGQTGGVRMAQLDAHALYQFSSVGTKVVVVD